MLRERSDESQDSEVLDDLTIDSLDDASFQAFRQMLSVRNPAHPWNKKNDGDFLRLIGAINKGEDKELHPTVAGLLMFGYDFSIISEFPNYHLDYLEYSDDFKQWTYRLTSGTGEFTGNIFNFITEVSARLNIQNQKRKVVENMARVDDPPLLRAQRELLSNALIHSDYRGLRGIRAELPPGRFRVRNPGDLRIPMDEMFAGGVSDPRNLHIAVMLSLIGMVERVGAGYVPLWITVRACRYLFRSMWRHPIQKQLPLL